MRFNQDFEMAVETILLLKKKKRDGYLQSGEVAKNLNYSAGYLHKVTLKLGRYGIMECKRGVTGGIRIRARQITLLDVWKAIYGGFDYNHPALPVMKKPLKAFADSLDKVVIYKKNTQKG